MRPAKRTMIARGSRTSLLMAAAFVLSAVLTPGPVAAEHTANADLPDLSMLQPADFHLERKGGTRLLRFSTTIVNIGDGAFDVYGYEPTGAPITSSSILNVTQRIEDVDASGNPIWSEDPTPATMFYSGDGHNHWHVYGLQLWELAFEATPNDTIAKGAKTGFCFWDNAEVPGFDTAPYYDGDWACHQSADGTSVPMGLSVGWGDEYPWNIAGQYIDVSDFPYGDYCLTLTADPNGEFTEKTTDNNKTRTLINIADDGVTVLATDCVADTTAPTQPTGLTATAGDTKVALDWADNAESDLAGYNVYRDSGSGYALVASVSSSAYTDSGLTNDKQYCYQVTAEDSFGNESLPSDAACATPTASAAADSVHVADLDGRAELKGKSGRWEALVTVTIRDDTGAAVGGATVTGEWTGAASGIVSGATASDGTVTLSSGNLSAAGTQATFTVSGVSAEGLNYDSTQNTDPEDDSDGTAITITKL